MVSICGNESCGKPFEGRPGMVYCSVRCRKTAAQRRWRRRRQNQVVHLGRNLITVPGRKKVFYSSKARSVCGLKGFLVTPHLDLVTCRNCLRLSDSL